MQSLTRLWRWDHFHSVFLDPHGHGDAPTAPTLPALTASVLRAVLPRPSARSAAMGLTSAAIWLHRLTATWWEMQRSAGGYRGDGVPGWLLTGV